jgi:hypothetical protein
MRALQPLRLPLLVQVELLALRVVRLLRRLPALRLVD